MCINELKTSNEIQKRWRHLLEGNFVLLFGMKSGLEENDVELSLCVNRKTSSVNNKTVENTYFIL